MPQHQTLAYVCVCDTEKAAKFSWNVDIKILIKQWHIIYNVNLVRKT